MSVRRVRLDSAPDVAPNRLKDVLTAGIEALATLKDLTLQAEDVATNGRRQRASPAESNHYQVVAMTLNLSPFVTPKPYAVDWNTKNAYTITRGFSYAIKRPDTLSRGFFGCNSQSGATNDYAVGFISNQSKYAGVENFGPFLNAVAKGEPTANLPRVKYAAPKTDPSWERGDGYESPYVVNSKAFMQGMANDAKTWADNPAQAPFSEAELQAFMNVYLFYKVSGDFETRTGLGRYIALGRFEVVELSNSMLTLKALDPLRRPQPQANWRRMAPSLQGVVEQDDTLSVDSVESRDLQQAARILQGLGTGTEEDKEDEEDEEDED